MAMPSRGECARASPKNASRRHTTNEPSGPATAARPSPPSTGRQTKSSMADRQRVAYPPPCPPPQGGRERRNAPDEVIHDRAPNAADAPVSSPPPLPPPSRGRE